MHKLITKLLAKRGIKDTNDLSQEERSTFESWQAILSKDELTIEDVKQFCQTQLGVIEGKWADLNLDQVKKAEFIPYHTVYKTLLLAIDSPKTAREAIEQQLNQLIS